MIQPEHRDVVREMRWPWTLSDWWRNHSLLPLNSKLPQTYPRYQPHAISPRALDMAKSGKRL